MTGTSGDTFKSLFGRSDFTLSFTGGAASGCAAVPYGMRAAALVQSGGTVNFGTAGNFAFYATTGTAVSENSRLKEVSGNTLTYEGTGGLDLTGSSASGQVQLSGATSGTVTLSVKDAAGSYTFKLPDSAGSSGQVLTADGTGATSWTTPSGGGSGGVPAFDTLSSGSTVTWSFSGTERRKAKLTLSTNSALSLTGVVSGSEGDLYVKQDATGGRTLTLPANSYVSGGGAGGITLSSTPNAIDKLHFAYDGTYYYWDAPVTNYSAAPSVPRGVIFDGSTQYAHVTLPNSAPWSSMGAFRIVYRVRAVTTGVSGRFFDAAGSLLNIESSGRIDLKDWRDGLDIFHSPADLNDSIVKVQFDPSNGRWTEETWKADGTGYVYHTVSLLTTSNYDMHGLFTIATSNNFAQKLAARYDWFYIRSGVDALGVFPGAEPGAGTYLAKWTFDDTANPNADSSGNGHNLTLVGSPTFENTP